MYHVLDARILQADGVQHSHWRLAHAVWWIAQPRLQGCTLEHDRAGVTIAETLHARVFLAEADAAGKQYER